jgi:hypothetical protein
MKRLFLLAAILLIFHEITFSQSEATASKPIAEIFTDFHINLVKGSANTSGFGLNRAYIGYNYAINKNFFAVLILNLASPDELAKGSKARRYAYFREASMNYAGDKLNITMGMIKTTTFIFQQNWWGLRYLAKPIQDWYCFGTDSDLGISVDYKFSNILEADLSLVNGEGGGNLELDNNLKSAGGLTLRPSENVTVRLYGDVTKNKNVWQNTSLLFAGYRSKNFFLGAEFDFKTNLDTINGHNAWGISATGGVNLSEKILFFSRYDLARSVVPAGENRNWNYRNDGSFYIVGVQYSISKAVRIAIDYQSKLPDDNSKSNGNLIYLNLVMKI